MAGYHLPSHTRFTAQTKIRLFSIGDPPDFSLLISSVYKLPISIFRRNQLFMISMVVIRPESTGYWWPNKSSQDKLENAMLGFPHHEMQLFFIVVLESWFAWRISFRTAERVIQTLLGWIMSYKKFYHVCLNKLWDHINLNVMLDWKIQNWMVHGFIFAFLSSHLMETMCTIYV